MLEFTHCKKQFLRSKNRVLKVFLDDRPLGIRSVAKRCH